jgi:hypothetical protein
MKLAEVTGWVEQHPTESIVIGAGGLIAVLWLLGFFSSSSSADSGSSNLASAYYAAEAQQAVVGGQIQMTTLQTAAATAQNAADVNGSVAIAKSQSKAATTINGQNATAATTINANNNAATTSQLGTQNNDQLLATYSNNSTALGIATSNNTTQATIAQAGYNAGVITSMINSIIAPETAKYGSAATIIPGIGYMGAAPSGVSSINDLTGMGYSTSQAQFMTGVAGH